MSINESTMLLCLFHHKDHASVASKQLQDAGVSTSAITTISGSGAEVQLTSYGMPKSDEKMFGDRLREGAILLAVQATSEQVSSVERIFRDHSVRFVDEFDRPDTTGAMTTEPPVDIETGRIVPIIEEQLTVGKRTVDQGGVRIFRRVVEIPVSESVHLRKERVVVDRRLVDRSAEADFGISGQMIEFKETAEEVVLSKSAHVVEEVLVGKRSSDHVEQIQDTVRHTEIQVEEIPAETYSSI